MSRKAGMAVLLAAGLAVTALIPLAAAKGKGGFDEWGYNYQANIFNGIYENWYRQKYTAEPPWQEGDLYLSGIFGPAHLVMKWDKLWDDARFHEGYWKPGAWCTNDYKWTDPDTGRRWHWYYRIVVAPLDPPPDGAEDIGWGHPEAEDGTLLCFWAIFRVESGTGPYLGPTQPNGFGAYKK